MGPGSTLLTMLRWQMPLLLETSCPILPNFRKGIYFDFNIFWFFSSLAPLPLLLPPSLPYKLALNPCVSTSSFGIAGVFITIHTHFQISLFLILFIKLDIACISLFRKGGGQRTTFRSGFSFYLHRSSEFLELRLLGLVQALYLALLLAALLLLSFLGQGLI